jgi:hypothetical protein
VPSLDILFKDGADEHFADKQVVTVKPGGSYWSQEEQAAGYGLATIEVDEATKLDVCMDPTQFRVNDKSNPTAINKV